MLVIKTKTELHNYLDIKRIEGLSIGFVPTMGALHDGHLSLVLEAEKDTDFVVVSIFVNPTQFNNPDDLKFYPRTFDDDLELLKEIENCVIFYPDVDEMYQGEEKTDYNFGDLEKVMEGEHRPGHFKGVAQIVSKLFYAVRPDKAFFGEKDFQQLAIIRALVKKEFPSIEILGCPTVREDDGLAMSSRNMRLDKEQRKHAPLIYQTLKEAIELKNKKQISEVREYVIQKINNNNYLCVEYFEIVDRDSLTPLKNWDESTKIVGCIAVFCGEVRLIDNITIE